MNRNCPNCGAPYSITETKCPYCSTMYMDLTDACFEDGTPMYLRIKTPFINNGATVLMKCIPHLGDIEVETDTTDICSCGSTLQSVVTRRGATMNMSFTVIEDEGSLFKVITDNEEL